MDHAFSDILCSVVSMAFSSILCVSKMIISFRMGRSISRSMISTAFSKHNWLSSMTFSNENWLLIADVCFNPLLNYLWLFASLKSHWNAIIYFFFSGKQENLSRAWKAQLEASWLRLRSFGKLPVIRSQNGGKVWLWSGGQVGAARWLFDCSKIPTKNDALSCDFIASPNAWKRVSSNLNPLTCSLIVCIRFSFATAARTHRAVIYKPRTSTVESECELAVYERTVQVRLESYKLFSYVL